MTKLNLQWKTSECNKNSILFYYFPASTKKRIDEFKQRLSETEFHKCYINIEIEPIDKVVCIKTKTFFDKQKELSDNIYPINAKNIIGVTGTNGKTTTVDIMRQLLVLKNKEVLSIGTLGVWKNDKKVEDFSLTTPNYIDIRKSLYRYKTEFALFEVSSHALMQERFNGLKFDSSAWTSFSQDHLDFHGTMSEYFEAKLKILDITKKNCFISKEDMGLFDAVKNEKLKFIEPIENVNHNYFSISYNKKNLSLATSVLNDFNVGISKDDYHSLKETPGRFNIIKKGETTVIIDFAHTPDALLNIGRELKKTYPSVITVMGCGGDRDREKRSLMAKACEEFSEKVFVTSDNPRTENPLQIIDDIVLGFKSKNYECVEDRALAIKKAIEENHGKIILVAGKGHEKYIDQAGQKRYYSDEDEVKKVLNAL